MTQLQKEQLEKVIKNVQYATEEAFQRAMKELWAAIDGAILLDERVIAEGEQYANSILGSKKNNPGEWEALKMGYNAAKEKYKKEADKTSEINNSLHQKLDFAEKRIRELENTKWNI